MKNLTFFLRILGSSLSFLCFINTSAQASNLGSEIKSEMMYEFYKDCNDPNSTIAKLGEVINAKPSQWCGCLISQVEKSFQETGLEARLNQGDISLMQLEKDVEKIGEKAGEYCVERLFKAEN